MSDQSRREFLKLMSAVAATGLAGTVTESFAHEGAQADSKPYQVLPWRGDDFTQGHKLRDGELPHFPDKAESKVDFVIVGGGMAGLACAHYLKGEDILLLEQYEHTGGTSLGGSYRGIDYSMGAVCTGSHDGIYGKLFDDLKIKPAKISPEQIGWHYDNHWLKGNSGADKFFQEFKKLSGEVTQAYDKIAKASSEQKAELRSQLDSVPFEKTLEGYDKSFVGLMNNICRSFYCAGPDYVPAGAGYGMVRALTTDSYVFEGGNSGIAKALRRSVNGTAPARVKPSCFVWRVEPKGDGASVVYSDKEGVMHRVDCKHAVVSAPLFVATRLMPQLPQQAKDKIAELEFGSFVVANFCMKQKVFKNPYQSFADEPFPFCQMVLAESPYEVLGKYHADMGSVLTVYHPFEHGPAGRAQLLVEDRQKLAASMISQLKQLVEGFQGSLEQVVLTRWGHPFRTPRVSKSDPLSGIQNLNPPWATLAHSSTMGGSFEGAIQAAEFAAKRCLSAKHRA